MRTIKWIVVHCTATSQSTKVPSIQNYWKNILGWRSPGYHRIIEANGNVVTLAPDTATCNGVAGHNSDSLHVSYIGGVDGENRPLDNRTEAQKLALLQIVADWKRQYPKAVVLGHRDFAGVHKACPSFDAKAWWKCAAGV